MARQRRKAQLGPSPLESRIQEAIQSFERDPSRSIRALATEFRVPRTTLAYRLNGRLTRNIAHTHKTTKLSRA